MTSPAATCGPSMTAILMILPEVSGRIRWGVLDGVAHVFLDGFELVEQAVGVGRTDALQRRGGQFGAQAAQFAEQRAGGLAQIKPVDAAVGLVAAALDPAIVAELVDQ